MTSTVRIERQCAKLARTLEPATNDEIALLRAARILKKVHAELSQAVRESAKDGGWTYYETTMAQRALNAIEQDLRRILLDHLSLQRQQIRSYLADAIHQSFETLDLLAC